MTSEPRKSVGRPRVAQAIEDLVVRMARENRSWGYDRIQGALKHLGFTISDQTVGNILKRHGIAPAPERKKTVTWREFVRCHLDVLLATNFFNSDVWNRVGLILACLYGCIDGGRRHVHAMGMLLHQQMQEMRFCVIDVLHMQAQCKRWSGWIGTSVRSWAIGFGEALLFNPTSEFPPDHGRCPQPQDMS